MHLLSLLLETVGDKVSAVRLLYPVNSRHGFRWEGQRVQKRRDDKDCRAQASAELGHARYLCGPRTDWKLPAKLCSFRPAETVAGNPSP